MPLIIAPINTNMKIKKIFVEEKLKKHLQSLGIMENGEITVLDKNGGNVICIIKEGRIAIDKDLARKIIVC